jgi:hypothetical protein
MKSYLVTIIRTAYKHIEVDAENKEQAETKAWDLYQGDADDCAESVIWEIEEMEEMEEETP